MNDKRLKIDKIPRIRKDEKKQPTLCSTAHSSTRKLYYHVNVSQIKGKRIERIKKLQTNSVYS